MATDPITIRLFGDGDPAAAWTLFHDTIHHVNTRDYDARQVAAWAPDAIDPERWRASFDDKHALLAVEGDLAVGFADLRADGYLDRFFVHHERQRAGIGRRLLAAIEQHARACGLSRIFLEASLTARPFFESAGYRVDEAQTVTVRGVELDNFKMSKRW